ncbi:MAG: methylmalonyl-CoA mutase family protein [Alphaproteobacteria bacterium]
MNEADSKRDRPWIFRTYAGHTAAAASNRLYRKNLEKGQTGLSVAFDLPTQTGYDADHPLAKGETGKVGVPVAHLGDMRALFEGIPLDRMNTSMTINATAPWLLALYIAVAGEQGAARKSLQGTTQNDIMKEYLSRGTYIFPPAPSLKLTADTIAFTAREMPKWNPVNICSYHLQEAGATPEQEIAFALANAMAVLDAVRTQADIPDAEFARVTGRISFFVNAGIRFVEEMCKMRAFTRLWDEICRERYGVEDPKFRRFRYGVQVNSLGLTEQQPENNVYRILLEMLGVTLSKGARARAVQLPAWNEALGLPRPWDQQWSLRAQQILAYETDLLEYEDIFDGAPVVEEKVRILMEAAQAELARIAEMGGAVAAVENAYMKMRLVESNAARLRAIESGGQTIVGVNAYEATEPSPLAADASGIEKVPETGEAEQTAALERWRAGRDAQAVADALGALKAAASEGRNIMPPSIEAARAGVTTGEWAGALREVFGEYRAPTGVSGAAAPPDDGSLAEARRAVARVSEKLGRRIRLLVGKPGLDGHSNGAEQIAMRARDCGMEVVYEGIRLTPERIVNSALEEDVHAVGLSILSGSHIGLAGEVVSRMEQAGLAHVPVVVGGIIPADDTKMLLALGVRRVFGPKDYQLNRIMAEIASLVEQAAFPS